MSMAKPIIASDLEQISKIIHPALHLDDLEKKAEVAGQIGILVEPKHTYDFVKAAYLLMLLEKNKQELLGNNARNKVGTHYTWSNHIKNIRSFLQQNT